MRKITDLEKISIRADGYGYVLFIKLFKIVPLPWKVPPPGWRPLLKGRLV